MRLGPPGPPNFEYSLGGVWDSPRACAIAAEEFTRFSLPVLSPCESTLDADEYDEVDVFLE